MRMLGRLLLAAVGAACALALSASPAAAVEAIEVFDEPNATHCSAVTITGSHMPTGGCIVDVHGEDIELSGHVFGVEQHALVCDNDFTINIGEDGTGYVSGMNVIHDLEEPGDNSGCEQIRPCISEGANHNEDHINTEGNEAGEHAWRFEMEEIGGPDSEEYEAHVYACFITAEMITECEGEIDFRVYEEHPASDPEHITEAETVGNDSHAHGEASQPENAGFFSTHCEIEGHYDLEPREELHINHPAP